jgi:SAM-dependent methyltransferase
MNATEKRSFVRSVRQPVTFAQYWALKTLFPRRQSEESPAVPSPTFRSLFPDVDLTDKTVLDFGCGTGEAAIECARLGARQVIGVDIQARWLEIARHKAMEAGVTRQCSFDYRTDLTADFVLSLNAFEHYDDPAEVLIQMQTHLKPEGRILIAFGPLWKHPYGGHLFSVFPWAHLLLTEAALIRWRSDFKTDGATKFGEVAGGLNQMTVRKFEQFVERSRLRVVRMKLVPIKAAARLHNRVTREYLTSGIIGELTQS